METINYKDSFVKVYHLKKLQMYLNPRKCYCCNENIGSDENVILMINNHKYIPNMLLHEVCYNSFTARARSSVFPADWIQRWHCS